MWILAPVRKLNQWVLGQIKPEMLLEAKVIKLVLPYLEHITRRLGSLEKTVVLGKIEGSRKRGIPNMRQVDSMKEVAGMTSQELRKDC